MKIEDITIEHFNRSIKNENITIEMWDEEVLLQPIFIFIRKIMTFPLL